MTGATRSVPIRGEVIRLGQFLKVADAVEQGGDVKALLATRTVRVNGEVEVRRGRQLRGGDLVAVGSTTFRIDTTGADGASPATRSRG